MIVLKKTFCCSQEPQPSHAHLKPDASLRRIVPNGCRMPCSKVGLPSVSFDSHVFSSSSVFLELPVSVVQGTNLSSFQPA